MSRKVALIVASLALSIISLSGGCSEPAQFVTYTDEANGFAIDYPEEWHVEHPSGDPQIKVAIWRKKVGQSPIGIIVTKYEASGHTLESFSGFQIGLLPDKIDDYAPISTEEITINGIPAMKHIYNETLASHPYTSVQVYLVHGGAEWILAFHSPQESFASYEPTGDTALNSFRLLE